MRLDPVYSLGNEAEAVWSQLAASILPAWAKQVEIGSQWAVFHLTAWSNCCLITTALTRLGIAGTSTWKTLYLYEVFVVESFFFLEHLYPLILNITVPLWSKQVVLCPCVCVKNTVAYGDVMEKCRAVPCSAYHAKAQSWDSKPKSWVFGKVTLFGTWVVLSWQACEASGKPNNFSCTAIRPHVVVIYICVFKFIF